VNRLRKLIAVVFLSGALSGLLFVIQHFAIFPLIEKAEIYESADEPEHHDDEGWRPTDGLERVAALIHPFIFLSILTTGMFWLSSGSIGGLLYQRWGYAGSEGRSDCVSD
jgi:predicted cobalt transporter CbtA